MHPRPPSGTDTQVVHTEGEEGIGPARERATAQLPKGPRGGGRDHDAIAAHVLSAEVAYARKLGVKHREPAVGDTAAITDLREAIVAAITGLPQAAASTTRWPPRYAPRRIAWHALDHAGEIEDRTTPVAGDPE